MGMPNTVVDIAREVRHKQLKAEEIVMDTLSRIDADNPALGAYLHVSTSAVDEARALDARIAQGKPVGPLCGVPIAVKDLIDTANLPTTYGGKVPMEKPIQDAWVLRRLQEAGAILIGKTNLHEYAFGTTNNNPHYGPARNPWDPSRIAGGSSGGSAVAVSANLCAAAIGTDTGGSIRIPSALTGHVGLKATYGLVGRSGILPLAPSLDHVGPMTKTVEDAALLLTVMAGWDPADPDSVRTPPKDFRSWNPARPLRVGFVRQFFCDWMEEDVSGVIDYAWTNAVQTAIRDLNGTTYEDVTVPMLDTVPKAQATLLFSEALTIHQPWIPTHGPMYGTDLQARFSDAKRYSASDYVWAKDHQRAFHAQLASVFEQVDVLVMPTVPIVAPPIGTMEVEVNGTGRPVPAVLNRCTNPWNLAGVPALTLPCGQTTSGLPVGLQLVAPWWQEGLLLGVADRVHDYLPSLTSPLKYE